MNYRKRFVVEPHAKLRLGAIDPSDTGAHRSEAAAKADTDADRAMLARLQKLLYAERKHSLLVVLQGLDAAGKDGTVNHVLNALNPQGARVGGFKQTAPV